LGTSSRALTDENGGEGGDEEGATAFGHGGVVDWPGLLRKNVQTARQVIRKLMTGQLVVMPNADLAEFVITGERRVEPLLPHVFRLPIARGPSSGSGFTPAF